MNTREREFASVRIWIDIYRKRLETTDGADYAVTKAYLAREEAELAKLLAPEAA